VQEAVAAGLEAVIVNPSVTLGPRDVNQISGSIIIEAARGLLRFTAPGGVNFVDVDDVALGHLAAASHGRVGERYILGAHNLPYAEAIPVVCRVVGKSPPAVRLPSFALPPLAVAVRLARAVLGNRVPMNEGQVRLLSAFLYADSGKAQRELGLPQTPFESTVQKTYNWYMENGYLPV
jgi:dihydroflavonol-4-reductase